MKRKFRKILIGAGAFLAMTSVTFAGILQTSDSIAEEKLDSPKALFTANGKFTVTENVAGSSVQDLGGDVLFPSESRTGCLLTATEENTILFNKKFSGVFEMDFRSWSDKSLAEIQPPKTVTDPENPSETIDNPDYFDAYWSNYDDERLADAYNLREAQITFDDGENYFTIHTYAGGSNGFSCMASAGVSINGGDVYSIFYNDSTGDIMSHRSNSYKTQMYGVSMGQSARSYGTYPTLDKSLSTKIGFDPMTMQAYCYGYAQNNSTVKKYVVWELAKTINKDAFAGSTFTNDEIRTLSDFGDEYSVSFSFADIADGKEARALVYSVCGQSLAGAGEFATDNGPSLAVKEMSLGVVGTERNMKDAVLASNDFFEGKSLEFNGIVDVTLPNGEKESLNESTGYFYTPKTAGVYQLSYSAKDGKGNVGEPASVRWTVLEKDLEEGKPVPELFEVGANVTMTYDFDSPDYMYLYRGVKMSAHKDGSTISFKNPLELQKDVPLIEFAALTSQIGKYDFSEIEFKITDANDPNVYVTVYYNFSKWGNYLANVSAGLNGGLATGWNYDKKVMQAKGEGGFSGLFSFTGEARTGETCSLYFDNQESAVVISPTYYANNKTVIDFNSSRCIESEQDYWNGFESGSVYLSITLRGLTSTATPAELFISKINGQSLYGSYLHDSKAPVIQIDTQGYDAEQLPHAEVGKAYSVFQAFAIDEAIGEVSDRIVCKAFYDYGKTTQREIPISDGKFVPDEAGKITVEYSAVDDLDNKGVKTLTVTAEEKLGELKILFESELIESLYVGETYKIPEYLLSGGSGNKSVAFTLTKDGQIVPFDGRILYLEEAGEYVIEVRVTDYIENEKTFSYPVSVTISDAPVIVVGEFMPALLVGKTYILPDAVATDWKSGTKPQEVQIKIYAQYDEEERVEITQTYVPEKAGRVTIIYEAISLSDPTKVATKKKFLQVNEVKGLKSLFVSQNMRIEKVKDGLLFIADEASSVRFVNPIFADAFTLRLQTFENNSTRFDSFKSFDITLSEVGNEENFVTLSLSRDDICEDTNLDSYAFRKIAEKWVYITFTFTGVTDTSAVLIKKLCNQPFASTARDIIDPVMLVRGYISPTIAYGKILHIPALACFDIFDPNAKGYLSVTKPDGTIVCENARIDEDVDVLIDQFGTWVVEYVGKDHSGNSNSLVYSVKAQDTKAPALSFSGTCVQEASVGDKIKLPVAVAQDNLTQNVEVLIFVIEPDGYMYTLEGRNLTVEMKGIYQIVYFAKDDAYNYVSKTFKIKVG